MLNTEARSLVLDQRDDEEACMILKDLVSRQPLGMTSAQIEDLAKNVYEEAKHNHQASIAAENKHRKTLNN